jgi:hypothetical protein
MLTLGKAPEGRPGGSRSLLSLPTPEGWIWSSGHEKNQKATGKSPEKQKKKIFFCGKRGKAEQSGSAKIGHRIFANVIRIQRVSQQEK